MCTPVVCIVRGGMIEVVCLKGVERLLTLTLRNFENFKRSTCFSAVFQGILERVLRMTENDTEDIGRLIVIH